MTHVSDQQLVAVLSIGVSEEKKHSTETALLLHSLACYYDGKTQYLPIVPKSADAIVDKNVVRVGVVTITASRCVHCLSVCIYRHL